MKNAYFLVSAILAMMIAIPFLAQDKTEDGKGFYSSSTSKSSANGKSTATGEVEERKVVSYKVTGESVVADASLKNGKGTVKARVNGVDHELTVTAEQLKWDDKQVALKGFNEVRLFIDGTRVEIRVDGKTVISAP